MMDLKVFNSEDAEEQEEGVSSLRALLVLLANELSCTFALLVALRGSSVAWG